MSRIRNGLFFMIVAILFQGPVLKGEDSLFKLDDLTPPGIDLGGVPLPNQYQCLTGSVINAAGDLGISPASKKYRKEDDEDEFDPMKFLQELQGTTFSGKCPAPGKVIDNISCDRLCPDPKDCPRKAEAVIKKNERAEAAQKCVVDEASKFKLEVGCAKGLLEDIKKTAQFLMQKMKAGLSEIRKLYEESESVRKDLVAKAQEASQKEQELDQEIQKAEAEIAQIEGQVQELKQLQRRDADQERMFKEMRDLKIPTARAMECVYQDSYKPCQTSGRADSGEPKSIADYAACVVENRGSLQQDGSQGSRSAKKRAEAAAIRTQLEKVMADIRRDAPKQSVVPSNIEELAALQQEPTRILSFQDLERKYGAALRSIQVPGFNVGAFILSEFNRCFQRSASDRQRDQTLRSTQFGELATKIKNDREQTQRLANNLVTGLAQSFRKADDRLNDGRLFNIGGVSPQRTIIPIAGCVDTKPDIALGCLENLRQLRRAQLTGEDFPPKVGGQVLSIGPSIAGVKGTNKRRPIARVCKGLTECRDRYRFIKQETVQAAQEIETELQPKYKQDAQRILQRAQSELAFRFGGLAKALGDQLESMKSQLTGLGISGRIDAPVKSEGIELGPDGLPQDPKDLIAFINGGPISTPIPDLGPDAFDDTYENIAERVKELEGEMREVADANEEVKQDAMACVADAEKDEYDELTAEVTRLGNINCGWITNLCTQKEGNLSDIAKIMGRIKSAGSRTVASLKQTVLGVCVRSGDSEEKLREKKALEKTQIAAVDGAELAIKNAKRKLRAAEDEIDDANRKLASAGQGDAAAESALRTARKNRDEAREAISEAEKQLSVAKRELDEVKGDIDDLEDDKKKAEFADCRGIADGIGDKARRIEELQGSKKRFSDSEAQSAE